MSDQNEERLSVSDEEIAGGNLFMMCERLNPDALSGLPAGYHFRTCRRDELEVWMTMHYDDKALAEAQKPEMRRYFEEVYAPAGEEFWERCLFVCRDAGDEPVGTCFAWLAYGSVTTIHWYKVRKDCEGLGLGRAMLSEVMKSLTPGDYPVFLHTHPACCRALRLYSDFGFSMLKDAQVGFRKNDLEDALPYLRRHMPERFYNSLKFAAAPENFLRAAASSETSQF